LLFEKIKPTIFSWS